MRNPERIKPILQKLETLWREQPDLRLGQLIYNLCYNEEEKTDKTFFMEDDKILDKIEQKIEYLARQDYLSSIDS